jgi:hypothetical protein
MYTYTREKEKKMSTRSAIAVTHNNVIKGAYCHYDGYPDYVGRCLVDNYNFEQAVQLVAHGDMSSLGKRVVPLGGHSFTTPEKDTTVFYGRDRGERDIDWMQFDIAEDFMAHYESLGCEFFYILGTDGAWYVKDLSGADWKKVSEVLESVAA